LAGFHSNETSKLKKKEKKCTISESVSCIMSLYMASNIMLFCSRYRFYWTSQLWSCNRGYCGSVDLYCEWNIHHEEEARPNFCCSRLLQCSLRSPVSIQEGRGANHSHPLLRVHDRRTPAKQPNNRQQHTTTVHNNYVPQFLKQRDINSYYRL
jgi:hypothetical protein